MLEIRLVSRKVDETNRPHRHNHHIALKLAKKLVFLSLNIQQSIKFNFDVRTNKAPNTLVTHDREKSRKDFKDLQLKCEKRIKHNQW